MRELAQEQEHSKYGTPLNSITWAKFKPKYLDYSQGAKAAGTFQRDRAAISALEKFRKIGQLFDINPELLELWKAQRKRDGRGNATINRDIKAVKRMMRTAKDWGYIRTWDGSSVKKLRESRGRLLYYTPDEVKRLLSVCKTRHSAFYDWETICKLAVLAGLRRSEIYWLSWADVSFDRRQVSVIEKEGWHPKNGESRHIPMSPSLMRHLKNLPRSSQWVLGDRPSLTVMSAFFRRMSRMAGLAGNIHTLRHTFASWLVQAGVDLFVVSELLGHLDPKMTKIYAHLAPVTMENAVNRLPAL